ncbi:hypothetical protein L6241_00615 [Janibacter sp. Y6]|uniref:hypothetical protein n=1 Tax=Janibacter sp. Y6 TaxID=2913552 RepID=UPI0034A1926E
MRDRHLRRAAGLLVPAERLPQRAGAAAGIALVNSLGNLAGFAAPFVTGWVRDGTCSTRPALWLVGTLMCAAAVVVVALGRGPRADDKVGQP